MKNNVLNLRIAYVVNHAAFFVSHRLPLALAARKAGCEVALFTGQPGSMEMEVPAVDALAAHGISHRRTISRSSGMNPLIESIALVQLIWYLWRFKPDVVHCASPKGVLYGGIAARSCRVPGLVLAISGMGYAYTDAEEKGFLRRAIKRIYGVLVGLSFAHPGAHVIVQNQDDQQSVLNTGWIVTSRLILIPGSGVDLSKFTDIDMNSKKPLVVLPARMLKDKGVCEFVEAARQIKAQFPEWHFVLAGAAGYDNPSVVSEEDLQLWQKEGVVEWLGHVPDMTPLYKDASIACLPSYREGMPKALMEAAAAGCAVVTTDVPGCREVIEPGHTGDLVPARDSRELAEALIALIQDPVRRLTYGRKGRDRAISLYSLDSVVKETLKLYQVYSVRTY